MEGKLTRVSAPAGFDKATLLARWVATLADSDRRVTWVSLDQSDSEPASWGAYVISQDTGGPVPAAC